MSLTLDSLWDQRQKLERDYKPADEFQDLVDTLALQGKIRDDERERLGKLWEAGAEEQDADSYQRGYNEGQQEAEHQYRITPTAVRNLSRLLAESEPGAEQEVIHSKWCELETLIREICEVHR